MRMHPERIVQWAHRTQKNLDLKSQAVIKLTTREYYYNYIQHLNTASLQTVLQYKIWRHFRSLQLEGPGSSCRGLLQGFVSSYWTNLQGASPQTLCTHSQKQKSTPISEYINIRLNIINKLLIIFIIIIIIIIIIKYNFSSPKLPIMKMCRR